MDHSYDTIERAIVKIYVDGLNHNYKNPWQSPSTFSCSGSGLCIIDRNGKPKVLTNAHVIENSAFIEIHMNHHLQKYEATIDVIGNDCDLALLDIDEEFWGEEGIEFLEIGAIPKRKDIVVVYGFPKGGEKICITKGTFSRIEMGEYSHYKNKLLDLQISAPINDGNSGGPVICNGKVAGVVHQGIDKGQNIGYAVPTPVINHFLDDARNHSYKGFPQLSIRTQKLENPTFRELLGMKKEHTGVRVASMGQLSDAKDLLLEDDVLLKINGINIRNDGTIRTVFSPSISFYYLITQSMIEDTILFTILREGIELDVVIKLTNTYRSTKLVPPYEYNKPPTYYINSGVVFVPLTKNLINKYTKKLGGKRQLEKERENEQIIVVREVLTSKLTKGYDSVHNCVVTHINGIKIYNIHCVIDAMENNTKKITRIKMESSNTDIVVKKMTDEENTQILKTYHIPNDRSIDLVNE